MIFLLVTTFDQNFYSSPSNYFEKRFAYLAGSDPYVQPHWIFTGISLSRDDLTALTHSWRCPREINVRAVGKIYPEFAFFLKGNLHDAWKSDKSNGVAVCSATQPEQRWR
jgi:hypothetical protein